MERYLEFCSGIQLRNYRLSGSWLLCEFLFSTCFFLKYFPFLYPSIKRKTVLLALNDFAVLVFLEFIDTELHSGHKTGDLI